MTRNGWIALITGLVIACLCISLCSGAVLIGMVISRNSGNLPIDLGSTAVPVKSVVPTGTPRRVQRIPLPTSVPTATAVLSGTLDQMVSAVVPRADLPDLAVRFRGVSPKQGTVSCPTPSKGYDVGATRNFILSNQDNNTEFTVTARLEYKTESAYMWVEQAPRKIDLNANNLQRAADQFTSKILATNRAFFGSPASLGADCDPHLYILHASGVGSTVGGYFSSPDSYPRAVRADSNEAQMFVVNAEAGYNGSDPGSAGYMSTLAHELQHMISFSQVHAPALWIEEGAAQLAERLNGYASEVGTVYAFANAPGTQLDTWSESSAGENSSHYGGGYLFWSYLYDRFGPDIVKQLVHTKERSIPALMKTLADAGIVDPDTGKAYQFDDLFADFVVANYMGRQKLSNSDTSNRYNFTATDIPPMATYANLTSAEYPYDSHEQVNQFGTHYIELRSNTPLSVAFTGSTSVPLLPTDSSGRFWWSNRVDESDSRLTREFDLTHVKSATLQYSAWYRMEKDFDYGYASVSTDNGATWKILKTGSCTTTNPNGANLGCGYTGSSGSAGAPQWMDESADLTAFAGKKILVRFEVVTDAGVNREGLALRSIRIPEIGFKDDTASATGWKSEGFVLADNLLPQYWKVQLIITRQDGSMSVQRLPLTDNAASVIVDFGQGGSKVRRAVLCISATTPIITEAGSYELQVL